MIFLHDKLVIPIYDFDKHIHQKMFQIVSLNK